MNNLTNITNISNSTSLGNSTSTTDPWVESGAMVYVALSVATLSAVVLCCTWFVKKRFLRRGYGLIYKKVELNRMSDDEEDVLLGEGKETSNDAFTLDASDSDEEDPEDPEKPEKPEEPVEPVVTPVSKAKAKIEGGTDNESVMSSHEEVAV